MSPMEDDWLAGMDTGLLGPGCLQWELYTSQWARGIRWGEYLGILDRGVYVCIELRKLGILRFCRAL